MKIFEKVLERKRKNGNRGFLPFVQEGSNLTRRYPREKTVERIACIKELRDQKKTIPQIKEILREKDKII